MKQILRNLIPSATVLSFMNGCGSTSVSERKPDSFKPAVIPQSWVADYSYEEPLPQYFHRQSIAARQSGKDPYVFFFAEWCKPCVRIRKRTKFGNMSAIFEDKHIVMMNFDYLQHLIDSSPDIEQSPIRAVPAIAPLGRDGKLSGPILYGDAWSNNEFNDDVRKLTLYFEALEQR